MEIIKYETELAQEILFAIERRLDILDVTLLPDVVSCGLVETLGSVATESPYLKRWRSSSSHPNGTEVDERHSELTVFEIGQRCTTLLAGLANTVLLKNVRAMSTSNLRRVVFVYTTVSVQSDVWIDAVEEELMRRKYQFLEYGNRTTLLGLIASNADFVKHALQDMLRVNDSTVESSESVDAAPLIQRKSGGRMKAFFRRNGSSRRGEDNDHEKPHDSFGNPDNTNNGMEADTSVDQALDFVISSANTIATTDETQGDASNIDHNRDNDCSVWLEMGRCQQLIEQYRRRLRHDDIKGDDRGGGNGGVLREVSRQRSTEGARRRDAAKQIMSRLLP